MSGLDKMKERIQQDADNQAAELLRLATQKAEAAVDEAGEAARRWQITAAEQLGQELADYQSRALSARELRHRRAVLEAKQEVITNLIEKICTHLRQAKTEEYFSMLEKMFQTYVHGEKGRMYLSEKDLARMPEDFEGRIAAAARKKGGEITLMKTPGSIPDGFLLEYDGIEENCTFEALVDANRNRLADRINTLLWRDKNAG